MTEEKDGKFIHLIPGFIRHDFPRKLIALFFAVLVYYIVSYKIGKSVKVQGVPVNIAVPAELVNMDSTVPKVTVTLRGSERRLSRISPADIKIKVKVDESKFMPELPYNLRINPEDVKTPLGTRVVSIVPSEMLLLLENKISKPVEIKAKFNSVRNLPKDYAVGKVKLNPSSAMVTGPKSIVEKIQVISTSPIPLDKTTVDNFDYRVKLTGNYNDVKITPEAVTAEVEIVKEYLSRTFKTIPIRILRSTGNSRLKAEFVSTPHADVVVSGVKGQIMQLKPKLIKPYVDISGLDKPGNYSVGVHCWVDFQDVSIKSIYPKQVQVKLIKAK